MKSTILEFAVLDSAQEEQLYTLYSVSYQDYFSGGCDRGVLLYSNENSLLPSYTQLRCKTLPRELPR